MISRSLKDVGNVSMRSAVISTSHWSTSVSASQISSRSTNNPTTRTSSSINSNSNTNSNNNSNNNKVMKSNGSFESIFKYSTPNENIEFKSNVKVILIPSKAEYEKAGIFSDLWISSDEIEQQRLESEREIKSYMKSNKCDFSRARTALYQGSPVFINTFLNNDMDNKSKNTDGFYIINDVDGFYIDDSSKCASQKTEIDVQSENDWFIGDPSPIPDPQVAIKCEHDEDHDDNTLLQFQLE